MQKSLRASLLLLFLGLLAPVAYSQGTIFSYAFVGDTSPLHVSAAFTATSEAVATGLLTTTNIISGYMQMGDRRVPIGPMVFPVNSPALGGGPIENDGQHWLNVNGLFGIPYPGDDWIEIDGGTVPMRHYGSSVKRDVYPLEQQYWDSDGWWSVSMVPEPSSLSLLLLALVVWRVGRVAQPARR